LKDGESEAQSSAVYIRYVSYQCIRTVVFLFLACILRPVYYWLLFAPRLLVASWQ